MSHTRWAAPPALVPLPMLVLLGALTACQPARPNVLLITVDTLRADSLGAYGAPGAVTPNLDALAARGVRFERAYAHSSWTAPSIASLLSSLAPDTHGVTRGRPRVGGAAGQTQLASKALTFPEALRMLGYRTFAVVTNGHLKPGLGFAQGFRSFVLRDDLGWEDHAEEMTRAVIERRAAIQEGEGPWFLWVHYYDPHASYELREPWSAAAPLAGTVSQCGAFGDELRNHQSAEPNWLACARAAYATEVSATDASVGRLFAELGVSESDLVILTADHGEEFREHGGLSHGRTLYDEVTHVPLIVAFPDGWRASTAVATPVGLMDVLPTVLDYLGAEPSERHQGSSVLDLIEGNGSGRPVVLSVARKKQSRSTGLVDGRWKLIRSSEGDVELYDLESDPNEQQNLADRRPAVVEALEEKLKQMVKVHRAERMQGRVKSFSRQEVDLLKEMGYVE